MVTHGPVASGLMLMDYYYVTSERTQQHLINEKCAVAVEPGSMPKPRVSWETAMVP